MLVLRAPRAAQWLPLLAILAVACSPLRPPQPPPPLPAGASDPLARAVLIADIDSILSKIERVHPNPYSVVPRDSIRRMRDRFVATLPTAATRATVWPAYARMIAALGDGHTSLYPPDEEIAAYWAAGGPAFPLSVVVNESEGLTVAGYWRDDTLAQRGDVVLAVNGITTDSLLRLFRTETSGESDAWKNRVDAGLFANFLWYNGISSPFSIEVRRPLEPQSRTVKIDGVAHDSILARVRRGRAPRSATGGSPNLTYRNLGDGVGLLDLFSLGGTLDRFRTDLDAALGRALADSTRTLVIDLRRNGGGDTRLGDELLAHLTSVPYRMSSSKQWKMSAEYRAFMLSMVKPPLNHAVFARVTSMGRKLFAGPDGTVVPFQEEAQLHPARSPQFTGPVCVLIGPGTFSSAADLADAIKTYHLATNIGEESGGRPNSFGEVYFFRSPHTGFLIGASSAAFVRASGDTTDRRGVMPEIEVRPTSADLAAGRDAALDRARSCPARR